MNDTPTPIVPDESLIVMLRETILQKNRDLSGASQRIAELEARLKEAK